jgi:hypothetical protein
MANCNHNKVWPYAMRMANDVSNFAPGIRDAISPIEKLTQVAVAPRVRRSHTFGSPVYVLENKLQTGKSIPKWNEKSRIGLYLGSSPRHSRNVALVLNLRTGHVSPQFHVLFDDLFETLRSSSANSVPSSQWQVQTGFTIGEKTTHKPVPDTRAQPETPRVPQPGIIPPTEEGPAISEWPTEAQDDWNNWDIDHQEEQGEEAPPPIGTIGILTIKKSRARRHLLLLRHRTTSQTHT